MKFGIYRVNPNYLRYLRDLDQSVPSPELNLYVGPVMTITGKKGSMPGFVHLNEQEGDFEPIPYTSLYGHIGRLNLNKMIPCPDKMILCEDDSLSDLERDFILKNETLIKLQSEEWQEKLKQQRKSAE